MTEKYVLFFFFGAEKLGFESSSSLAAAVDPVLCVETKEHCFPPEDSTFSWEQKHSQHPWIPGCGRQSDRFHNMVPSLLCWTLGVIWLYLFCFVPQLIEWFCVEPAAGTTTPEILKFSFVPAASSPFHPWSSFMSLSCWEWRQRSRMSERMFAVEVNSFVILSHNWKLQNGNLKCWNGPKIWVAKKSDTHFSVALIHKHTYLLKT